MNAIEKRYGSKIDKLGQQVRSAYLIFFVQCEIRADAKRIKSIGISSLLYNIIVPSIFQRNYSQNVMNTYIYFFKLSYV